MKGKGFTFIELIIVVAILGIIFVVVILPLIRGEIGCTGTSNQTQSNSTA